MVILKSNVRKSFYEDEVPKKKKEKFLKKKGKKSVKNLILVAH